MESDKSQTTDREAFEKRRAEWVKETQRQLRILAEKWGLA